jgi:hypothetical protein
MGGWHGARRRRAGSRPGAARLARSGRLRDRGEAWAQGGFQPKVVRN